eukprot:gene18041-21534_t
MSVYEWARQELRRSQDAAQEIGFDPGLTLRAMLSAVVQQSKGVRSFEDLADELQYLAENLDDQQDYVFGEQVVLGVRTDRDLVFLGRPGAQVDQFATVRTEGTVDVFCFPFHRCAAGWAFDVQGLAHDRPPRKSLDLGVQPGQVLVIDQHVIGMAQAVFTGGLGLENRLHLRFADAIALQGTLYLQRLRHVDHQHPLGHGDRVRRLCTRQVAANLLGDQRVQQRLQPAALVGHFEDQLAQRAAVQLPVRLQHTRTEMPGNLRQGRAPGFDYPARGVVGVNQVHAKPDEVFGGGAF